MEHPRKIVVKNKMDKQKQDLQELSRKGRDDPIIFIEKLLGMPLHEGQKKYIKERTAHEQRINVLTCANRWGKSVTIACLQLWHLYYKIGINNTDPTAWEKTEYRTANIAPHSALTEPVFKTMGQILTSTFSIVQDGKMTTNDCIIGWFYRSEKTLNTPPYKQFFNNNSYIEHRSLGGDAGDSLQGKPYGYISYDEGGRSDHLESEINDAILARLFDWNGKLDILSTPSTESKSNLYYYQLYQQGLVGVNNTFTMSGSLRDNTFFSEDQIQAQYDLLKDNPMRDQMLEGKFVFGGNTLFNVQSVLDARDEQLDQGIPFTHGHKYCLGIDTAIGRDEMVYKVIDITTKPYRQVAQVAAKGNSKSPQLHLHDLIELFDDYNQEHSLRVLLETWNGESVRFYHDLPDYIKSVTDCYGSWQPDKVRTNNDNPDQPTPQRAKKADILICLKKLLSAGDIKIPKNDQKTVDQLSIYREDDAKLPTDRVFSLALACYSAEQLAPQEAVAWIPLEW